MGDGNIPFLCLRLGLAAQTDLRAAQMMLDTAARPEMRLYSMLYIIVVDRSDLAAIDLSGA